MQTTRTKLFLMMVLEFFIWGAWLPPIWEYMGGLGFNGTQIAWVGSAFAIASVLAIFFANQYADRHFASERFLAVSHLVGGLAILGMFFVKSFPLFFTLMLIHSIFYVPTISVTNSLAFANLKDPQRDFGRVRMGGTVGWILAAWPLYFVLQGKEGDALQHARSFMFIVSGGASLLLAAFCLTLPHTPPKPAVEKSHKFAWLESFRLLALPYLLILFIVTFIDATIHNGYFVMVFGFLGKVGIKPENIMPVMSLGQIAEIVTMFVLGTVLAKLGWRTTMIVGILGHAVRFAVFAFFPQSTGLIIGVQVLHGICYAFFFATVYIFIDAAFPKDVRASAQGLFNLLILGLGDLAAKWIFIPLQANLTPEGGVTDFRTLFLVPTGMALGAAILLGLFFKPPKNIAAAGEAAAAAH